MRIDIYEQQILKMKKITLLIIAFSISYMLHAQDSAFFNFKFNHLALSIKDVNRSVDFYTKVFQLHEITNRSAIEGIRWISLNEGKELHLISILKEQVVINKAVHLALATKNIEAFVNRLTAMKIEFSDFQGKPNTINARADGIKQIYLQDPDGYWIEVNNDAAAK